MGLWGQEGRGRANARQNHAPLTEPASAPRKGWRQDQKQEHVIFLEASITCISIHTWVLCF